MKPSLDTGLSGLGAKREKRKDIRGLRRQSLNVLKGGCNNV